MFSRRDILATLGASTIALPSHADAWRRNLNGVWNNASGTPLQRRPPFTALVAPERELTQYESGQRGRVEAIPGDDVGQDGAEWFTPDAPLVRVRGEARTSIIVDPPNGQLPYRPEGRRALIGQLQALGNFDGADSRPPPERCLMGFGDPAAPPMLYAPQSTGDCQFVQTPDAFVIRTEANHDLRIVNLAQDARRGDPASAWQGVSRGRWEGEDLVVETTGFRDMEALRSLPHQLYISTGARVTERFSRFSPDEIVYAFTVDDPKVFTQPWRGETTFRRTSGQVLDYDCHEGNYALPNILRGARAAGSR